jgi:hypothetical protein
VTPIYRIDQAADGMISVWHNYLSEYVLRVPAPPGLVVAATFENLARSDPRRADDFLFGYAMAVVHCADYPPSSMRVESREVH